MDKTGCRQSSEVVNIEEVAGQEGSTSKNEDEENYIRNILKK